MHVEVCGSYLRGTYVRRKWLEPDGANPQYSKGYRDIFVILSYFGLLYIPSYVVLLDDSETFNPVLMNVGTLSNHVNLCIYSSSRLSLILSLFAIQITTMHV